MIFTVLPMYNEERNIAAVLSGIRGVLGKIPHRIIAVNDGSTDRTKEMLNRNRKNDLTVVTTKINMNVGAVFSSGIHAALSHALPDDTIVILEGDGTSDISLLPALLSAVKNGSDIVIASRYLPGGGYRNFPFKRHIFSLLANAYMKYFFPIDGVTDYTIFYRAYRADLLFKAREWFGPFGIIQSRGFVANVELLVKLSHFAKRISEVPFVYDYGTKAGNSKLAIFRTVNEYFTVISYLKFMSRKIKVRSTS